MVDEENEEEEEVGEGKVSMLKLFLMMVLEDDEEEDSWTPKRRSPTSFVVKEVHVLQLCPILPQCEHFLLPIVTYVSSYENDKERKVRKRIGLVVYMI